MVFYLRNFFEVLFSYVIFREFPIISLEPYEFSNLERRQSHVRRWLFSSLATWVRHASRCEICAEFR